MLTWTDKIACRSAKQPVERLYKKNPYLFVFLDSSILGAVHYFAEHFINLKKQTTEPALSEGIAK